MLQFSIQPSTSRYLIGIAFILAGVLHFLKTPRLHMTIKAFRHQEVGSFYFGTTLLRLPLQFVLMYWVYWACIQH